MVAAGDQHFRELRVQRKLRHDGPQVGKVAVVVERRQVIEQLQGSHQSLRSWGIHEVEMDQIVDAQFLQLKDHRP